MIIRRYHLLLQMTNLALLRAGLMDMGDKRGEPGGTGELRGRGEGDLFKGRRQGEGERERAL